MMPAATSTGRPRPIWATGLRACLGALATACALVGGLASVSAQRGVSARLVPNGPGLSPVVSAGVAERQVLGPAGFTVDAGAVFLADPLAGRAIEYDRDLQPRRAWRFGLAPQDLMRTASGQLCAVDAAAERLECRASASAPGAAIERRLRGGAIALVPGPRGAVWVLRGDGFAGPA